MLRPLVQYRQMISPVLPKAAQSTKTVSTRSSPAGVRNLRLTARPNSATCVCVGKVLRMGSRVRFPNNNTRLKLGMKHLEVSAAHLLENRKGHESPNAAGPLAYP